MAVMWAYFINETKAVAKAAALFVGVKSKFVTVQNEGDREVARDIEYYNLDVIISVGYRVKSNRSVEFRRWLP